MVRAILEGRKVQTRRVVKPQPRVVHALYPDSSIETDRIFRKGDQRIHAPYQVGTRLWVRETYGTRPDLSHVEYRADRLDSVGALPFEHIYDEQTKWRSSMFMPRKYSRIDLTVTDVRCRRLQDISEEDAMAEGFYQAVRESPNGVGQDVVGWYARLWDAINAKRGFPWASNPWVWAYTFERILE